MTLIENIIVVVSAPIGEEICKALAVWSLAGMIDSKKRGFQVGFTVGLGFALLENLQYILLSLFAGELMAFSYGFTSVVRGIGSIPGHAMWTACSGYALGHMLEQNRPKQRIPEFGNMNLVDPRNPTASTQNNKLYQDVQATFFNNRSNLELPTSLPVMLCVAILGHAFWNGSSVLVSTITWGLDPLSWLFINLTWTVLLIALLWTFGKYVIAAAMDSQ